MVLARNDDPSEADLAEIEDFVTQTDINGKSIRHRAPQDGSVQKKAKIQNSKIKSNASSNIPADKLHSKKQTTSLVNKIQAICCFGGVVPPHAVDDKSDAETVDFEDSEREAWLLPPQLPQDVGKKCLVLDLDETLVHSTFKAVPWADFAIPVKIGDKTHFVYVTKRPGVDEFLREMAKSFEIVIYTASRDKYADPLIDILDPYNVVRTRLYRESCVFFDGFYIKDLSRLNRDLNHTIIVDNSPNSYLFHPENAIDCTSFIDDPFDQELFKIGAFLKEMTAVDDVRTACTKWRDWQSIVSTKHR